MMRISSVLKHFVIATVGFALVAALGVAGRVQAQITEPTLAPSFSNLYSLTDLGSVPGIPLAYGGLTFKPKNPDVLLIGGSADTPDAGIYSVKVKRGYDDHIIGFGVPSFVAKAPGISDGGIDAGLVYTPKKDVLLYTTYGDNTLGEIQRGSAEPDKKVDLSSLGITSSTGALNFVPQGFAGAGRLKITSYTANEFYDTTITPDGSGTYDINVPSKSVKLDGGLDSFIYVKAGNPGFSKDSLLIEEYDNNRVSAYTIDQNGDPIPDTRQDFITELGFHLPTTTIGVMGATIDPVTGDFLFVSYFEDTASESQSESKIFAVRRLKTYY
jgi:hypothetical protein